MAKAVVSIWSSIWNPTLPWSPPTPDCHSLTVLSCALWAPSQKTNSLPFPGFSSISVSLPGLVPTPCSRSITFPGLSPTSWQRSPLSVGCKVFSEQCLYRNTLSSVTSLTWCITSQHRNTLKSQRNNCSLWSCFLCPGNCVIPSLKWMILFDH